MNEIKRLLTLWLRSMVTTSGGSNAAMVVTMGGELHTYHLSETVNSDSANFNVSANPSWQAFLTGSTGALSATVKIYASNFTDDLHWKLVGTMTLSVASWTSSADDDNASYIPDKFNSWLKTKATISDISGANATVTVVGG